MTHAPATQQEYIVGKHILAVDDEEDILDTIEDILDGAIIDTARDYTAASQKIQQKRYDLAILDIMGVNGLKLLEEAVARGIPTVMLTAHAINPETLMASIQKGAISYLPKEMLAELDTLLNDLLAACEQGRPPWKLLFDKLEDYFDERFGAGWKDREHAFWNSFKQTWQLSQGIQQRLARDPRILARGV